MLCLGLQSHAGWFKSIPRLHALIALPKGFELCSHRWVSPGEFFDRYILRFIVGKSEVPIGAQKRFFGFLQMVDRFIDLINGGLKFSRR